VVSEEEGPGVVGCSMHTSGVPVDAAGELGVDLVERVETHKEVLVLIALHHAVNLAAAEHLPRGGSTGW
jgi:hypothetical protein